VSTSVLTFTTTITEEFALTATFDLNDLMDLLTSAVGLPATMRTADAAATFADLDLDSLAFLQLQIQLSDSYGFELPDDRPQAYTLGEIVAQVQRGIEEAHAA
jgi:minimal PKS acyl carrier protein